MSDAMVERAARAMHAAGSEQSPYLSYWRSQARAALDAALPVVDTVEALDALPVTAVLLDVERGELWYPADHPYPAIGRYYHNRGRVSIAEDLLADVASLRVVSTLMSEF